MIQLTAEEVALLDDRERQVYSEYLERQLHLTDLFSYMQKVSGVKEYPHTKLLCQWIDALLEGRLYSDGPGPVGVQREDEDGNPYFVHPITDEPVLYNLAIYMGPRHGKSFVVTEHLPAYALTKFADLKIILATYGDNFSHDWSAKVRDRMVEQSKFFGVNVIGENRAARDFWETTNGGAYLAAGKGGQIIGKGWQLGIADDLLAGYDEAKSPAERQNAHEWWRYTWWRRRERWMDGTPPRGLLMNTRWHMDDIAGRVVTKDKWAILNVPGLSLGEGDPLGRPKDEPLCQEIMPKAELIQERLQDPQMFAAQYQGNPYLDGGNILHDPFNLATLEQGTYTLKDRSGSLIRVEEADCYRFGVVDLAASVKKTADYTVVTTIDVTATTPRRMIVRDVMQQRLQTHDHMGAVADIYAKMGLRFLAIEDITFGTNLLNQLRQRGDIVLRPVKPIKDKVVRALPLNDLIRDEILWWMEGAEWRMALEDEVLSFPDGAHDDIVDTLAYAAEIFRTIPQVRRKKTPSGSISEREAEFIAGRRKNKGRKPVIHPQLGRI